MDETSSRGSLSVPTMLRLPAISLVRTDRTPPSAIVCGSLISQVLLTA
jgi:hypothetical protein